MDHNTHTTTDSSRGHETSDAHFKSVVVSGAGLFGVMIFGLLVSVLCYSFFTSKSPDPGKHPDTFVEIKPQTLPPLPRLQSDPHATLLALRAKEDSILTSYGWSTSDSAKARIPINRAMELLVHQGLPVQTSK